MNILAIEKTGDIRNAKLDQLAVDLKQIKMANPAFAAEICLEFKERWRTHYFKNEQRFQVSRSMRSVADRDHSGSGTSF
jgi:hypothetical protein